MSISKSFLYVAVCVLFASGTQISAKSTKNELLDNIVGKPIIRVIELGIIDEILRLSYEIRNNSKKDVWVLAGLGKSGVSAELFMEKDDRTILIRRRLDVPIIGKGGDIPPGRYERFGPGKKQIESVSIPLPVHPKRQFAGNQAIGVETASGLAVEIGYYVGNLPAMIRRTLEEVDRIGSKTRNDDERMRKFYFGGSLYFNKLNEVLRQRNEEIFVPYSEQWFKGEQILRGEIDGVRIPYEEKEDKPSYRFSLDLHSCIRVNIRYQPSVLDYFFPYEGQQSLLNHSEVEYLKSVKEIIVEDLEAVRAFVNEINKPVPTGGIVRQRSVAEVVCHHDDGRKTSFPIYNDHSLVIKGQRFTYDSKIESLRVVIHQIRPFELRMNCAANLRNLWHRLRLYYKATGQIAPLYPSPSEWCDSMISFYKGIIIEEGGIRDVDALEAYVCPSVDKGKCHYAMNENCKFDSASDLVLLFETEAGWNQHGGPELFMFDNHDPKGGCVLLNDGTVKLIRTKEELHQLRWK